MDILQCYKSIINYNVTEAELEWCYSCPKSARLLYIYTTALYVCEHVFNYVVGNIRSICGYDFHLPNTFDHIVTHCESNGTNIIDFIDVLIYNSGLYDYITTASLYDYRIYSYNRTTFIPIFTVLYNGRTQPETKYHLTNNISYDPTNKKFFSSCGESIIYEDEYVLFYGKDLDPIFDKMSYWKLEEYDSQFDFNQYVTTYLFSDRQFKTFKKLVDSNKMTLFHQLTKKYIVLR